MNRRAAFTALAALATLSVAPSALAGSRTVYHATVDGVASTLTLDLQGDRVGGELVEGSLRLTLQGTLAGGQLRGDLIEPSLGLPVMSIQGPVSGGQLVARLRAVALLGGAERVVRFTAGGAAPAAPVTPVAGRPPAGGGAIDSRLVGRWVHEKIINSGGSNFASFNTVRTLELDAGGRVAQYVLSAGGGGNWSYDGGRRLEFSGQWYARDGILYVRPDQGGDFQAASRYRFADQYLVTESQSGKQIWRR